MESATDNSENDMLDRNNTEEEAACARRVLISPGTRGFPGGEKQAMCRSAGRRIRTPLHIAAKRGDLKTLGVLLKYGKLKTVNQIDLTGKTPLHLACKYAHFTVGKMLVRTGADVNLGDHRGNAPLHYAALAESTELFEFLAKYDADLRGRNCQGKTPIDIMRAKDLRNLGDRTCLLNVVLPPFRPARKDLGEDISPEGGSEHLSLQDFEVIKPVKKIKFGEMLYIVKLRKSGQLFTMKTLKRAVLLQRNLYMKYALMEQKVLSSVKSPFIVSLKHYFFTEATLCLVFDYVQRTDLSQLLRNCRVLSEQESRIYCAEIVLALESLHRGHIVYRNLKPRNVDIDEQGHIKLTNLGLAKDGVTTARSASSYFMSLSHLPPEILRTESHGKPADWYMLGSFLYELLTGEVLSLGNATFPPSVSPEAISLISGLTEADPALRLGTEDPQELKSHPFFSGISWHRIHNKVTSPDEFASRYPSTVSSVSQIVSYSPRYIVN